MKESAQALVERSRRWIEPPAVQDGDALALAGALSVPTAIARLHIARGCADVASARRFLSPELADLSPFDGLPGVEEAAARVATAIARREGILIHGDYDVDGLSSAAILVRFLRRLGAPVSFYIPHRLEEGYGLSARGVRRAHEAGATLLVTTDCGSRSFAEVELARSLGMDTVITDHHELGPHLPPAAAVVTPRREGTPRAHLDLCGAGVAFRLAQAVSRRLGLDDEHWRDALDLVALGTIADIVPLRGDNRLLARHGIHALGATRKAGLRALMDAAGIREGEVTGWHIAFVLAPRLNAAGRLGDAGRALAALLTDDPVEGRAMADLLDGENRARQKIDGEILAEAVEKVEVELDLNKTGAIVLESPRWHRGVVGIVASRIQERYGRPVVLLAREDDLARGSGRSVPGFDLAAALDSMSELFESHGGHPMAVGVSVAMRNLGEFRERLDALARESLATWRTDRVVRLDLELGFRELTTELTRGLALLEPHGIGNERPQLVVRDVRLAGPPAVVKNAHLRLRLAQDGAVLPAIAFNMADRRRELERAGSRLDLIIECAEDRWRGGGAVEIRVRDFLPSGDPRGRCLV